MNNKILRDEIDYWSKHLELDKFNFDKSLSHFLSSMSLIIGVAIGIFTIIMSLDFSDSLFKVLLKFLLLEISILFIFYLAHTTKQKFKKEINDNNVSFIVREEQLRRRYAKLGVSRKKLNDEHASIKKDYLEGKIKLPYSQ